VYTIETSFKKVGEVAFSADGRLAALASGSTGGSTWKCEVWSLPPDPDAIWTDEDWEPFAFGLAFDPRTGHILHCDAKEGLHATSPDEGGGLGWEVSGGPLRAFAVSPTGDRVMFGCELWNGVTQSQNAPDMLISLARSGKQTDWKQGVVFEGEGFVFSDLAFFPDGKRFASIEWSSRKQRGKRRLGDEPTLRIHDAKSLDEADATPFKRPAKDLVVCGNHAIVRGDKSFRVWDADDLTSEPVEVKTGRTPLGAVAADPQGRFVLTGSGDSVSVWDSGSWAAKTYEWGCGKITCLAVSPDGLLVAAGTATGKVVVWDTE
jgi:WD40 repeat protein